MPKLRFRSGAAPSTTSRSKQSRRRTASSTARSAAGRCSAAETSNSRATTTGARSTSSRTANSSLSRSLRPSLSPLQGCGRSRPQVGHDARGSHGPRGQGRLRLFPGQGSVEIHGRHRPRFRREGNRTTQGQEDRIRLHRRCLRTSRAAASRTPPSSSRSTPPARSARPKFCSTTRALP